jgi:hypothetical protein
MICDALGSRLNIQTGELSMSAGNSFGEVRARYSIYGGNTSVTLMSDKLAFDFPGLLPVDLPLVYEILGTVHDKFPVAFPEIGQPRMEVQDYAHLDLGTVEAVQALLNKFQIHSVGPSFSPMLIISRPSAKFTVVAEDGSWQCESSIEQSQLISSGLFMSVKMIFHKLPLGLPFLEKAATVQDITKRCLAAVGLESENASS